MKLTIRVRVFYQSVIFIVDDAHFTVFFALCAHEVVGINEVVAGIIRRVNIDHLDLAEIALLQDFQDFQIIALNIEILRGVPVAAVGFHGAQRFRDRPRRFGHSRLFTNPCKFIALVAVHHIPAQKLLQNLKIDPALDLAILAPHLRNRRGEQGSDFVYVFCHHVRCFKSQLIHIFDSSFNFKPQITISHIDWFFLANMNSGHAIYIIFYVIDFSFYIA